jgi:hypothetical protein
MVALAVVTLDLEEAKARDVHSVVGLSYGCVVALPAIWSSMAFGNGGNCPKQFSNSVLLITGALQATSAHGAGAHTPSLHHQARLPLP